MHRRRQLPNETVESYGNDLIRLFVMCQCAETRRKNIFIRGLRPDIRTIVYPRAPANFDEAFRLAKESQMMIGSAPTFDDHQTSAILQRMVDEISKRTPSTAAEMSTSNTDTVDPFSTPMGKQILARLDRLDAKPQITPPSSQDAIHQLQSRLDALESAPKKSNGTKTWHKKRSNIPQPSTSTCVNCGGNHRSNQCRKSKYCTHCERSGHTRAECYWAKKNVPCPTCRKCGQKGHEESRCRSEASN